MINIATEELGLQNDDQLSDALSSKLYAGLLNFVSALGEILGPVLGGYLAQEYSYQVAFGLVSAMGLGMFFVYYQFSYRQKRGLLSHAQEQAALIELNSSLKSKLIADSSGTKP
jgi:MFS family permease